MDDVARWPHRDRTDLFSAAAARRGVSAAIVEKDFWVCWTLKRLFTLPDPPAGLIFKGGTSLSKAYGAIERFSEDVDLSFQRADLGFGGENDPAAARSGKQRSQRLDDLAAACKAMVRDQLRPRLEESFAAALQTAPSPDTWQLALDMDDPDGQTLVFHYPGANSQTTQAIPAYLRPQVRLETGARGDHWPAEDREIASYAAETHREYFRVPSCRVHVLAASRTFCEKLTVLHAWHHASVARPLRARLSRHYYDVARLYETGIGTAALQEPDLLCLVAAHQAAFFRAGWAKYEEAVPGTLRLVPPEGRREELEQDYEMMKEMIFGDPPSFAHILEVVAEIERVANLPS
jgi:hypothetical protein